MPRALVLDELDGSVVSAVQEISADDLPTGDTLVEVIYSSLNYKDGLAVTGRGKVVRAPYPFVPGIDMAGRIVESESDRFREGDFVIGTGWGIGETYWGGYSGIQRVDSSWLVPLPDGIGPREAMVVGTAGLTAMLSVMSLESHGATPGKGEIVVSGASGGVGSMAVALLRQAGFDVVASTGSADAHEYLRSLGASRVIPRNDLGKGPERPLDSARWAGAVDVVGGPTLAAIISQLERHASVASCGLAGGHELPTTVFPFILRGVNLLGIDTNTCPNDLRIYAWNRIAELLLPDVLDLVETTTISLEEVLEYSSRILAGGIRGRVVVDVNA